jgi:4-carboxymuconolactone decarboxylase
MRSSRALTGLVVLGITVAAGHTLGCTSGKAVSEDGGQPSQASSATSPRDIHAETGNRFPAVTRDALNDAGKQLYDARGTADSFGPAAIRLYSPPVAEAMADVNEYLRRKSGLDDRLVELAILVTAREMDSEYVWTAHEAAALKAGLEPAIVDAVKHRKPVSTLEEKDAIVVQLGRDAISTHKVASDTFARAVQLFGHEGVVNIASLMGNYAATTILLNIADQHVRPRETSLLPVP